MTRKNVFGFQSSKKITQRKIKLTKVGSLKPLTRDGLESVFMGQKANRSWSSDPNTGFIHNPRMPICL